MLIYTLDPMTLRRTDVIEDYESCVWTERFIEAGDVNISIPATRRNAARLRPGTLLLHEDSDEPMLIESRQAAPDGNLTAVAKTIEAFFNERYVGPMARGGLPANILRYVVYNMQTRHEGRYAVENLRVSDFVPDSQDELGGYTPYEKIEGIERAHDALLRLAKQYMIGLRVARIWSEDLSKWELVFNVRETSDRSGAGSASRVLLSSRDDNLENITEIFSKVDWVDVVLVHPPKWLTELGEIAEAWLPQAYPETGGTNGEDWTDFSTVGDNSYDWRIREITSEELTEEQLDQIIDTKYPEFIGYNWADLDLGDQTRVLRDQMGFLAQQEWQQLTQKRKIVIDGEIPPDTMVYGRDYHLGDLVLTQGNYTGDSPQPALITEFVRTADGTGSKGYPTLSTDVPANNTVVGPPGGGGSGDNS